MFLFEHLLFVSKTSYVDKFILKGGLLISSMIGVCVRRWIWIQLLLVSYDRTTLLSKRWSKICSVDIGDGMNTSSSGSGEIRTDDPNIQISVLYYGQVWKNGDTPIKCIHNR